jgi:hypothetical protein
MKKIIIILALPIIYVSSTDNQRAKSWGGTEGMVLKPNEVLLNITWKAGDDLWILTKDTTTNIQYFREYSSWGVW